MPSMACGCEKSSRPETPLGSSGSCGCSLRLLLPRCNKRHHQGLRLLCCPGVTCAITKACRNAWLVTVLDSKAKTAADSAHSADGLNAAQLLWYAQISCRSQLVVCRRRKVEAVAAHLRPAGVGRLKSFSAALNAVMPLPPSLLQPPPPPFISNKPRASIEWFLSGDHKHGHWNRGFLRP